MKVEWDHSQRKFILWASVPSLGGNRIDYAVSICEVYSSEFNGFDLIPKGRFKFYVPDEQEFIVTFERKELRQRWPNSEEYTYKLGMMVEWIALNCRDEPWSFLATSYSDAKLQFSFANHVVAVAFKFVWQ